jgi:hypothetical protein
MKAGIGNEAAQIREYINPIFGTVWILENNPLNKDRKLYHCKDCVCPLQCTVLHVGNREHMQ